MNKGKIHVLGEEEEDVYAEPEAEQWRTAFVVTVDMQGRAYASADIDGALAGKDFERKATGDDIWIASVAVQRELETMNLVQNVVHNFVNAQMQIAAQIQQQAQNENIVRGLKLP